MVKRGKPKGICKSTRPVFPGNSKDYANNCVPLALTFLSGRPYEEVHKLCVEHGWSERSGMDWEDAFRVAYKLGMLLDYLSWPVGLTFRRAIEGLEGTGNRVLLAAYGHAVCFVDDDVPAVLGLVPSFGPRSRVLNAWRVKTLPDQGVTPKSPYRTTQ